MFDPFDLYGLEYAVVRLRNRLDLAICPTGDRQLRKVFCLGPAKSGTSSLHALFETNGLRSQHSAGNWRLESFDCFSDRGDYRPFERYDRLFPNAVFIMNCRPLGSYLRSLAIHRARKGSAVPNRLINPALLVGQAQRRSQFSERVLRYFAGRSNLIVVDIEKPGSIGFVAERLGLEVPEVVHHHKTKDRLSAAGEAAFEDAVKRLGGHGVLGSRLILGAQGESTLTDSLLPPADRVWL